MGDEKVLKSNKPGYVTFAKTGAPNSRTTQIFINYVDNSRLDSMGFAPFGEVEGDGMAVVKKIHNCGEKPNQGQIQAKGNKYLDESSPKLSKIVRALIVTEEQEQLPQDLLVELGRAGTAASAVADRLAHVLRCWK